MLSQFHEVERPAHYNEFDKEVKDIILFVLGEQGYRAYCQGNELKYRLRAGFKGDSGVDLQKAMQYNQMRKDIERHNQDKETEG